MDNLQKDLIKKLAYNKPLLSAIEALSKEVIKSENILNEIRTEESNQFVGEHMKAIKIASGMVNDIFTEIGKYKEDEVDPNLSEDDNPGH